MLCDYMYFVNSEKQLPQERLLDESDVFMFNGHVNAEVSVL